MRSLLTVFTVSGFLFFLPGVANAQTQLDATTQANAFVALQELENSLLGSIVWSSTINGGKCKPKFTVGFFSLSLVYAQSDTCPLLGKVTVGLFPLSANVDLDVNNLANVDRIQLKAKVSVKYLKDSGVNVQLYFTDGRISLRPGANQPWMDMILNGSTVMTYSKANYSIEGRKNIFNSATNIGFSLITQLSKTPPVRRFEGCLLTGGVSSDVNAGTLSFCTALMK